MAYEDDQTALARGSRHDTRGDGDMYRGRTLSYLVYASSRYRTAGRTANSLGTLRAMVLFNIGVGKDRTRGIPS